MARIRVEVTLALPAAQRRIALELEEGATAGDALAASGLVAQAGVRLALFGREVPAGRRLADGDRIDVLRPLAVDPKEARRRRARR